MFVVLSGLKGPISPTYRDQTQLMGVAFMQLMARVCARPILLLFSVQNRTFCPILSNIISVFNFPPWKLTSLPQAGPKVGC